MCRRRILCQSNCNSKGKKLRQFACVIINIFYLNLRKLIIKNSIFIKKKGQQIELSFQIDFFLSLFFFWVMRSKGDSDQYYQPSRKKACHNLSPAKIEWMCSQFSLSQSLPSRNLFPPKSDFFLFWCSYSKGILYNLRISEPESIYSIFYISKIFFKKIINIIQIHNQHNLKLFSLHKYISHLIHI